MAALIKIFRGAATQKRVRTLALLAFFALASGLHAEAPLPDWGVSYWSLDGGIGTSDTLVNGMSIGFIFDPKLSIARNIMLGSKSAINFSSDGIISLETQGYLRWNFARVGALQNPTNIFVQGGAGVLAAFKGPDAHNTRGSVLLDATTGLTIPLSGRWHIEPSIRAGYPFIVGAALTAGVKFPLRLR